MLETPIGALKTDMSDGQWHTIQKILKRNVKNFNGKSHLIEEVNNLVQEGVFIAGTNNSYRMKLDALLDWRETNGLEMDYNVSNNAPRIFGGQLEDDVWAKTPLRDIDTVYFRISQNHIKDITNVVKYRGFLSYDLDGILRIYSLNGEEIAEDIKEIAKEHPEYDIFGVRLSKNVKRRELRDLDKQFLDELCVFYGKLAHVFIRKAMTSVSKHIPEPDDIQQQIYMWVIDAIHKYNAETSTPFAAFLHYSLNKWVHDLNRKSFGRSVADSELQLNRALDKLREEENHTPSIKDIAKEMNETVERTKRRISDVNSVRGIKTAVGLYQEEGEYNPHLYIASEEDPTIRIEEQVTQTLVSAAVTNSIIDNKSKNGYDIISWINIYNKTWGDNNKGFTAKEEKILQSARERLM